MEDDSKPTTREQGDILEENVEYIFRRAGFETQRNVRVKKYEIDVLATLGNRRIVVECKNYQNSHLVVRNLVHQWSSKNLILKADKIILVVYGVNVKDSDRKLAEKFGIDIWDSSEVTDLLSHLNTPEKLKDRLWKELRLKDVSITDRYRDVLEERIFLPRLADEKEDEDETYEFMLSSLKEFIRTRLRIEGTTKEERRKHIELFEEVEKTERRGFFGAAVDITGEKAWDNISKRLASRKILAVEIQKRYLRFMKELDEEIDDVRQYFSGNDETTYRRLLKARLYHCLSDGSNPEFGFDQKEIVEVEAQSAEHIVLTVDVSDPDERQILNWILTAEGRPMLFQSGEVQKEKTVYTLHNIPSAVESIYRVLDEYFGYEEDSELYDFSLMQPRSSMCFIATAAFGTSTTEEIDHLRNWRDNSLSAHFVGKRFIDIYYAVSPPIASFIGATEGRRRAVRTLLKPVIAYAKKHGS